MSDVTLHLGDCLSVMAELPENSVDTILTDPPYNISKDNNFHTMNSAKRQGVDFGDWDKEFDLFSWIEPYTKLLDANGSIIIFCSFRYISHIVDELERCNMVVKDVIKWIKTNPMPRNTNRRYVQDTEFAVWAVNSKAKWVFNKKNNTPYLRAQFETPTVSGKERTSHPTQKSLRLMEEIISIHTNPDDIIIDPFMGSGTTGVACVQTGRNFIGIEIDPTYFAIAERRIKEAQLQERLEFE